MSKCIWNVAMEDRKCRFCTWNGGCEARNADDRLLPEAYLEVMNATVGHNVLGGGRNGWMKAHFRYMVAYQMAKDGFNQHQIGVVIGKDRATVSSGISSLREMLTVPYAYAEEADVWNKYTENIKLRKNEN